MEYIERAMVKKALDYLLLYVFKEVKPSDILEIDRGVTEFEFKVNLPTPLAVGLLRGIEKATRDLTPQIAGLKRSKLNSEVLDMLMGIFIQTGMFQKAEEVINCEDCEDANCNKRRGAK